MGLSLILDFFSSHCCGGVEDYGGDLNVGF